MSANGIVEELRASYRFRPIRKVIRTRFGVAAGETRKTAVPEWPEVTVEVANYFEHLKIKAADNVHLEKPAGWWEALVNEAGKELVKMGVPKEQVATRLVDEFQFPMSEKKALRYLHEEYKHPEKVKAGKASGEVRQPEPVLVMRADSEGLRKTGYSHTGTSLVGPTVTYAAPTASSYARRTYTPEEEQLAAAFSGAGFDLSFQHPVPMDKWMCEKCRTKWVEEPPDRCPKDGLVVGRLNYYVDILVRFNELKWAIEPGGKKHDFDSDKKRDDFLRAHGIQPFHFDNELVRCGAWFIVQYFELLRQLNDPEEHVLAIEGHCRHVIHNTTEIFGPTAAFTTKRPATVKIIIRS